MEPAQFTLYPNVTYDFFLVIGTTKALLPGEYTNGIQIIAGQRIQYTINFTVTAPTSPSTTSK